MTNSQNKYIALLRGINVGGHHKVPMKELSTFMQNLGFSNIITLLNSGNVIFESKESDANKIESLLDESLQLKFGFPIPVIVQKAENLLRLNEHNPFKNIEVTKDTRLYVSFLKDEPTTEIKLPWSSDDNSYRILAIQDRIVISILDLSINNTPKGMEALEKIYGKNITTRNWNTILKIVDKLK